jgi:hypothetical protein
MELEERRRREVDEREGREDESGVAHVLGIACAREALL